MQIPKAWEMQLSLVFPHHCLCAVLGGLDWHRTVWLRKVKFREEKCLAQGHTARRRWQNQHGHPGVSDQSLCSTCSTPRTGLPGSGQGMTSSPSLPGRRWNRWYPGNQQASTRPWPEMGPCQAWARPRQPLRALAGRPTHRAPSPRRPTRAV